MGILLFLFLFFIVIIFVVALPAISGVGTFQMDKSAARKKKRDEYEESSKAEPSSSSSEGYVPPDEQDGYTDKAEGKSKTQRLRERLDNVNIPIAFKTQALKQNEGQTTLRRRHVEPKSGNEDDPNEFDFDIDDLIQEEEEQKNKEYQDRLRYAKDAKERQSRYEEIA